MHKAQGPKNKDGQSTSDCNADNNNVLDYGKAGAIAEEVLSAIHTVTSFGGQDGIVERYIRAHIHMYNYTILNMINFMPIW